MVTDRVFWLNIDAQKLLDAAGVNFFESLWLLDRPKRGLRETSGRGPAAVFVRPAFEGGSHLGLAAQRAGSDDVGRGGGRARAFNRVWSTAGERGPVAEPVTLPVLREGIDELERLIAASGVIAPP